MPCLRGIRICLEICAIAGAPAASDEWREAFRYKTGGTRRLYFGGIGTTQTSEGALFPYGPSA